MQREVSEQLSVLIRQRDRLASHLDELRLRSLDDRRLEEIEKAGPMGVWDAIAQQLDCWNVLSGDAQTSAAAG